MTLRAETPFGSACAVSITSGMLEGNVMKSRASNLLEEITRLEASKQTSGSTLSAGDEPASPIVIAAVGGPRNCSQTSTEEVRLY